MPKILTPAMRAHLDEETTRLAAIWRITRKDGQQFFFTDHDRDIVFGGDTYRADAGFARTAIRSDAGFAVDNLDLVGVFAEGGIVEDEVRAGLFDGAGIAISFVDWQDPDTYGEIRLRRGTLGETRLTPQGYFAAELRGLAQPLAQSTLQMWSPECRADLGDARCTVPIWLAEVARSTAYAAGQFVRVSDPPGGPLAQDYADRIYECVTAGMTDAVQPTYDTTIGQDTTDGTAVFRAYDAFTRAAAIATVISDREFMLTDTLDAYADGWFDDGLLVWEILGIHFDDGTGPNDGRIFKVDTAHGLIVYDQTGWEKGAGRFFWHELSGTLVSIGTVSMMWPDRVSANTVSLSSVASSLCGRVGLVAGDLDVTELSDGVQGFGVARQISVRGALELLAVAYHFDCAESDHKLRFKKRGRVSSRTIGESELAPVNKEGEIFVETRAQDVDLPLRFTVRYNDAERDADVATQTAKRIAAPTATMHSANEATLDLPLTLTPAQAKEVALRQCFGPWSERTGHQWKLSWTHLDLDPGDVVTVALNSGRSYVVRILEMAVGADLSIALQTVTQESSSYDVSAVTSGGLIFRRAIASPSAASRLVLADLPLLTDGDDAKLSSGLYWAMGGRGQPAWRGGTLYENTNAAWLPLDEAFHEMAWGLPIAALGDTDTPFQTDRVNQLTVRMVAGASRLVTVSELAMLNGANQALLVDPGGGAEILQFATVTANADGSHTLSTLLRGRRGTEGFTGGHSVASLFVLVEPGTLSRLLVPLTALEQARFYRPVGRGEALRDAITTTITPIGRDLMPYAPVHIQASGSWGADITLTWQRRTRVGGDLVDGGGEVPLAEDSEAYELDILGTVAGPVLRTLEVTERQAVYTAAQQTEDWDAWYPLELVNPGAETGDKIGWTNELGAALVVDDDYENLHAAHTGSFLFRSASSASVDHRDTQTVDVTAWANAIDQGNATARGRVWVNETSGGQDHGRVSLIFLDGENVELGSEEPAYLELTPGVWTLTEAEAAIPVGTRTIKICLDSHRDSLPASVAFDDASLEINPGNALTKLSVVVCQISAQVGRGFPSAITTLDVS